MNCELNSNLINIIHYSSFDPGYTLNLMGDWCGSVLSWPKTDSKEITGARQGLKQGRAVKEYKGQAKKGDFLYG